jgi:hypothetical protein
MAAPETHRERSQDLRVLESDRGRDVFQQSHAVRRVQEEIPEEVRARDLEPAQDLGQIGLGSHQILMAKRKASPATRQARQHVIDLYNAWGKPDKAREYAAIPATVGRP